MLRQFSHVVVSVVASTFLLVGPAIALEQAATVTPDIAGVVTAGTPVELVKDGFNGTEGPIALSDGSLLFTENRADRVIRIGADGTISTFLDRTNGVNSLALSADGDLYAVQTLQPRVGIVFPADRVRVLTDNFEGAPFGRPNDIVIDKHGTIYFTDSGAQPKPGQPLPAKPAVYRIAPGGSLVRIASDIERPNGIQLSPDEKVLYVANTDGEYVLAYDIGADGSIGPRRNFAKLDGVRKTDTGITSGADGLAVDAKGHLYVASNLGVQVFSSRGEALGIIALPKQPQNLAFAGTGKKSLYVVGRGAVYRINVLTPGYAGRAK